MEWLNRKMYSTTLWTLLICANYSFKAQVYEIGIQCRFLTHASSRRVDIFAIWSQKVRKYLNVMVGELGEQMLD